MKIIQPVVIGVIFSKDAGKFLLIHRFEKNLKDSAYNNCWNFPGGGVEFGESLENSVIRELKEELGINIVVNCLIPKAFSSVRESWHGILICYICTIKDHCYTIKLNEESDKFGWFTLKQIKKLPTLPLAYEIAQEAKQLLEMGVHTVKVI